MATLVSAISLFALDINKASVEDLEKIKGISKEKAEAIVKYRQEKGGIKNINELKNVKGVGEQSILNIKNNVVDKKASNKHKKIDKKTKKDKKKLAKNPTKFYIKLQKSR
ncbi:competence protein ComEA [Campylobacter sputorum subsp. bubulus]|uniref:Competence protein ComEA n=1 Tax=Campylobacter sputorum subsp. sputorum TaxID=32024 RepID=A0A381DIZ8_9BACT|nr:helix-hairpin-helix domain-containing protein [Campylobacter sputorum]ASM35702.1 helix-hairpin-helix domain protein [Campylobacter sputorum aubsp. sputorum RM3237]SUX07843.1 competence protein ComEA [Campylobacter sputorum subsp. bubulus]SUX10672.1 competence protein ComEA [Campylobacter sputorum subsp. sputorum]